MTDLDDLLFPNGFGPPSTRRSLPIALLRAREALMVHFRPILARRDLTEQQWRVIRILAERGVVDATEIANTAFILAPSLTRMIRALEEGGLVRKQKDEQDGRRVLLEITPLGLAVLSEVAPESKAVYDRLEQQFGKDRLDALLDMLNELADLRLEV